MEEDASFFADAADVFDVLDHSDLVVHEDGADAQGLLPDRVQGLLQQVGADQSTLLHGQVCDLEAVQLQVAARVQDALVLDLRGDDVIPAGAVEGSESLQNRIVRLCGAGGKDDFSGVCSDQVGHLLSGNLHALGCLPAVLMGLGVRVPIQLAQVGVHRIQHPVIQRSRRLVVEVVNFLRPEKPSSPQASKSSQHFLSYAIHN